MKRLFLSLLLVTTWFLFTLEIAPASASTSEKKPGFFERKRLEKEQKKELKLEEEKNRTQVSTPFNVRRQVPQVLSPSPQKIDQTYTSEQRQVTDEKNTFNTQRQQSSSKEGFQLNPGNRSSIILPPQTSLPLQRSSEGSEKSSRQNFLSPQRSSGGSEKPSLQSISEEPIPSTPFPITPSGDNLYLQLVEAIRWKISVLTDQLKTREQEYINLPSDMRVQLEDLNSTNKQDLINWVYPRLIEAMLQLAGESYVKSKVNSTGDKVIEGSHISENIKDSYSLQRKIYEIENELNSFEDLKEYIRKYRERIIDLLVNHVRITYDLEPILGMNKAKGETSFQFGVSSSDSQTSLGKKLPQSGSSLPEKMDTSNSNQDLNESIGIGKLNVTDTGPLIIDFLLKNTIKIFPFKEYFGDRLKLLSVTDVMSYMSRLEGMINDEIVSLQRERKDLDDPNMRIAYGITGKLALEGFEPQAILYRNTDKESKEYSGAVFYRDSKIPEKCHVNRFRNIQENTDNPESLYKVVDTLKESTKENESPSTLQKPTIEKSTPKQQFQEIIGKTLPPKRTHIVRDVMVIAYSGSKSAADWEKNYKFISQEASGHNPLLWGYKIHEGIGEAFEQGYNDLGARFGEMMLKYKRQTLKYLNNCTDTRVELYIITTGHSLGGGLSTLATIAMKKMSQLYDNIDGLKVYVSNISFAAPPVFRKDLFVGRTSGGHQERYDWADRAEKFVGRGNVIRVFVDRDPVATFSLFRQNAKAKQRSLIMALLKYKHIGIPLMLHDIESMSDDLNYWKPHLMARYGLLVSLFANDKFTTVRDYLQSFEDRNQMNEVKFELQQLGVTQKALEESIQALPQAINTDKAVALTTTLNKILLDNSAYLAQYEESKKVVGLETKETFNVSDVESLSTGPTGSVKLGQSTARELEFTPFYPDENGTNIFVMSDQPVTLTPSTKCDPDTFWKNNIAGNFSLKPGMIPNDDVKMHTACSCCLLKNLVLSQESMGTRIRQTFGKKNEISTIDQSLGHCITKNYCTNEMINQQINFSAFPNKYNAISAWIQKFRGNALDIWRTKQLKIQNQD